MLFRLLFATVVVVVIGGALTAAGTFLVPRTNPAVTYEINWDSEQTERLVRQACYDCHSNETEYPWYSYVAPMAFLVRKDVVEGRDAINFSTGRNLDMDAMVEAIYEGEMPPSIYTVTHPRLSDVERDQLIAGLKATFMQETIGKRVEMATATECTVNGDSCGAAAAEPTLDPNALMPTFGESPFGK